MGDTRSAFHSSCWIGQAKNLRIDQSRIVFGRWNVVTGCYYCWIGYVSNLQIDVNAPAADNVLWIKTAWEPNFIGLAWSSTGWFDSVQYHYSFILQLWPSHLYLWHVSRECANPYSVRERLSNQVWILIQANLKGTFDELENDAQKLITENYGECSFTDTVLMEIVSVLETTSAKGYSVHVTPKNNIISLGLSKSIEQAHSLAERNNRQFCYYLEMSLKNRWLYNFVISMTRWYICPWEILLEKLAKNANLVNLVL